MESEAAERAITTDKEAAEEADANCPVCGVAWSEPNAQESTLGPQCARCGKKINGPLPENKLPTPPLQTSPNLFSRLFAAGKQQSPKTSHAQADPPQKQITEQTNEAQLAEALAGVSQVPTNKLHYFHCSAGAVHFADRPSASMVGRAHLPDMRDPVDGRRRPDPLSGVAFGPLPALR